MAKRIVIIGAGPGGLSAGLRLVGRDSSVEVIESHPTQVGGISRTVRYKGFGIDVGGHRFFSKSQLVEEFWTDILPNDLLVVRRSSSILYRNKFFSYPLRPVEALLKLGWIEALRSGISYVAARIKPKQELRSFEDWITHHFGRRLYELFFKAYTEKVWGMPCADISADWAAQRIRRLSLPAVIWSALTRRLKPPSNKAVVKSLVGTFRYPRRGPGMLWEECARRFVAAGGRLLSDRKVIRLEYQPATKQWKVIARGGDRTESVHVADHVISSAPLAKLTQMLQPELCPAARESASSLRYRDFLVVALVLKDRQVLDQNWVYVHDPSVSVGRIQNYKAWSPDMVPDAEYCCYGLEYFCNISDPLWEKSDEALVEFASAELCKILPVNPADIVDAHVVRQKKAYPVYDSRYREAVDVIRAELESKFTGLHLIGRNGMHRYNNQDHSIMTAFLCAENILSGKNTYDLWRVNQDAEYIEDGAEREVIWSHVAGAFERAVPSIVFKDNDLAKEISSWKTL